MNDAETIEEVRKCVKTLWDITKNIKAGTASIYTITEGNHCKQELRKHLEKYQQGHSNTIDDVELWFTKNLLELYDETLITFRYNKNNV